MKKGKPKQFGSSEVTQDCDTNTWGLIIWLGTRTKKRALDRAHHLVLDVNQIRKRRTSVEKKKK